LGACAHQSLAVATDGATAAAPTAGDGLSAWLRRDGDAVELAAAVHAAGAPAQIGTRLEGAAGAAVLGLAGALRLLSPVARLADFDEARAPDGVLTWAREMGPAVLAVHVGDDLVAVHLTPP